MSQTTTQPTDLFASVFGSTRGRTKTSLFSELQLEDIVWMHANDLAVYNQNPKELPSQISQHLSLGLSLGQPSVTDEALSLINAGGTVYALGDEWRKSFPIAATLLKALADNATTQLNECSDEIIGNFEKAVNRDMSNLKSRIRKLQGEYAQATILKYVLRGDFTESHFRQAFITKGELTQKISRILYNNNDEVMKEIGEQYALLGPTKWHQAVDAALVWPMSDITDKTMRGPQRMRTHLVEKVRELLR